MKVFKVWIVSAIVALTLAACQTPFAQSGDYKFEQASPLTAHGDETSVKVRFVRADGSPVANARVFSVGWQPLLPKQGPSQKFTPLPDDGHGAFSYESKALRSGDTLRLAARLESGGSLIYGSVEVH